MTAVMQSSSRGRALQDGRVRCDRRRIGRNLSSCAQAEPIHDGGPGKRMRGLPEYVRWLLLGAGAAVLAATAACQDHAPRPAAAATPRSNILVIVADDLGFSDLGAFGGEIDTPNLDRLARAGVRLTGFHTAPTCSPTRAMLLSGADNHLAGLGTMGEALTPELRGHQGYEGYLNRRVVSVAELLRDAGYFTAQAGKWHLGLEADQSPAARGFERSYTLLQGGHNHFGMDQGEKWRALGLHSTYRENGELVHYPEGRYSADVFTEHMLEYLDEAHRGGRPFFAYLTFSEPHWPLQAPAALIAKYRGRFDAGPEALRELRLRRLHELGLVGRDVVPHPLVGVTSWSTLTAAQRADATRRMEVYAAMVDSLDRNVGRLVERLRANGQLEDTLIVFLSDNGAEGTHMDTPMGGISGGRPVAPLAPAEAATLGIDNSTANIGSATSYVGYGPAWAQAATAPRNRYKGLTTEGGINTPAFITGPGVRGQRLVRSFTHVLDITPTLLQFAGVAHPDSYRGQPVQALEGHSWLNMLADRGDQVWPADQPVGWELFWRRAVRIGDWKAVYEADGATMLVTTAPGHWHLYDLARDPGETLDLADSAPARLAQLTQAWDAYARRVGVVLPPAADAGSRTIAGN
jgi:arylsulfatase